MVYYRSITGCLIGMGISLLIVSTIGAGQAYAVAGIVLILLGIFGTILKYYYKSHETKFKPKYEEKHESRVCPVCIHPLEMNKEVCIHCVKNYLVDKKTLNFYSSVIGINVIFIGALEYIFVTTFTINRRDLVGPIICVIGLVLLIIGVLKSFTLNNEERLKNTLSILFTISIAIYIISLFFPYYNTIPFRRVTPYYHAGGWIGFLLILVSYLELYYDKNKVVKILSLTGSLCMVMTLVMLEFLFVRAWTPTSSYYLYMVSFIINVIIVILSLKLPKRLKVLYDKWLKIKGLSLN